MEDISVLYKNEIGITFIWKRCALKNHYKINFIFNNTALHFTKKELLKFSKLTNIALKRPINCKDCCNGNFCKSMLLETPVPQISFAMSYIEIKAINDLIKGTLFELGLETFLRKVL